MGPQSRHHHVKQETMKVRFSILRKVIITFLSSIIGRGVLQVVEYYKASYPQSFGLFPSDSPCKKLDFFSTTRRNNGGCWQDHHFLPFDGASDDDTILPWNPSDQAIRAIMP